MRIRLCSVKITTSAGIMEVAVRFLRLDVPHASRRIKVSSVSSELTITISEGYAIDHGQKFKTTKRSEMFRVSGMMSNQGFGDFDRLRHRSPGLGKASIFFIKSFWFSLFIMYVCSLCKASVFCPRLGKASVFCS